MPTDSEKLRQMHFKKITNRIATPIAIPTPRTRPPSSTHIDLTRLSSQQALPARTTSISSPFKPPTAVIPRLHPSKQSCTKKTPNDYAPLQVQEDKSLPTRPKKKLKPNLTRKPSIVPNRRLPNLPLPQILSAPPTSNPSRYPSANNTKSTVSESARNPLTSSGPPNTHAKSSRSDSTSHAPVTRRVPSLSVCSESSSPPKASSSRTKPSKIRGSSDTRDSASTLSCLSDFQISTRSPSSDSVSMVSSIQTACPPPINIKADMQNQLSVFGLSLQTDRVRRSPSINQLDADPEESSLEISQIIDNPECLCPFCDELLPPKPSPKLVKRLKYLKSMPEVKQRSGSKNPFALYLPFPQIAAYCELHRAEKKLIPIGIQNGWPTKIDFQKLPRRIKSHRRYLQRICKRELASDFMDMALKAWAVQGPTKVQSVANELATFHVEQPGYYGVRGYEVIYQTLHTMFLGSLPLATFTKAARPLSPDFLLRKVLVPETALCLIADDLKLKVTDPRVRSILEDSRTYGAIMFPDEDDEVSEDQSSFESDDQSLRKSDEAAQLYPPPAPNPQAPSKKRPRKSESCEIEIIPSKALPSQRFRPPPTSPDHDSSIDQIRPTFQANLKKPSKRPGGDASRPIYPSQALKSGWNSIL